MMALLRRRKHPDRDQVWEARFRVERVLAVLDGIERHGYREDIHPDMIERSARQLRETLDYLDGRRRFGGRT